MFSASLATRIAPQDRIFGSVKPDHQSAMDQTHWDFSLPGGATYPDVFVAQATGSKKTIEISGAFL
jgi:hypothetical protein